METFFSSSSFNMLLHFLFFIHILFIQANHGTGRNINLPGQPVKIKHDSGYVKVGNGRELFYYFVESQQSTQESSRSPLVLWLNGGPGCSSLGAGALMEIGPFRVSNDEKTLIKNPYTWSSVAKRAEFFLAGESYGGHFIPQLANLILEHNNQASKKDKINLKGILMGNPIFDYTVNLDARYEFMWNHGLISQSMHNNIRKNCHPNPNDPVCVEAALEVEKNLAGLDQYNIYGPQCDISRGRQDTYYSIENFDPCSENYVTAYLNNKKVQKALQVKYFAPTYEWALCNDEVYWTDYGSALPLVTEMMEKNMRIWIFSGDTDSVVPFTSTIRSIHMLNLPIDTMWEKWGVDKEVYGYKFEYEGSNFTYATVRGAGHLVPSNKPLQALVLFQSFIAGKSLPPI